MFTLILSVALLSQVSPDSQLVIDAGRSFEWKDDNGKTHIGVASILTGVNEPTLQQMAERHAQYQAQRQQQGHQNWETRFHQLEGLLPQYCQFSENAAESWPWDTRGTAGPEMFKSWRQSSGHWGSINGGCAIYGYSMAKGRNGIWYGCGIVAQLRGNQRQSLVVRQVAPSYNYKVKRWRIR